MHGNRSAVVHVCLAAAITALATPALAHGIVGRRMFVEPITAEDANVKNELDLPNGEFLRMPDGTTRTLGASLEKALYPRRLSIVVETGRIARTAPDATGWDNMEMGLKWEAWVSPAHEFALSPALFTVLPTGSTAVTDHETAIRPMLLFAKGFGDLGAGWARPFALQGDAGYERSLSGSGRQVVYDAVFMYSLPYLNHWVRRADTGYAMEHNLRRGLSWGALWGNLFPFVEFNGQKAVQGAPGGTSALLRPGAAWMGQYMQVSVAADINLNAPAGAHRYGAVVLVDWFLDEIVPGFARTPFGHRVHNPD